MPFREITLDNFVGYVPKCEQTNKKEIKPKTTKAGSFPRKQNKNYHKTIKNWMLVELDYLNE